MSNASDRKQAREALAEYSLMTVRELSHFLNKSPESVRRLLRDSRIPWINVGSGKRIDARVDPVDATVFVLAEREGLSISEYSTKHGLAGCADQAQRYLARVRRAQSA